MGTPNLGAVTRQFAGIAIKTNTGERRGVVPMISASDDGKKNGENVNRGKDGIMHYMKHQWQWSESVNEGFVVR